MPANAKQQRSAQVANALARAVRAGEVEAADALRILRHELRRLNTNRALKITTRSQGAQDVVDKYGTDNVPKNGSPDALHSDHVHPLTETILRATTTVPAWTVELERLRTVVCVTARENYALERIERVGTTGPEKYAKAGIAFVDGVTPS